MYQRKRMERAPYIAEQKKPHAGSAQRSHVSELQVGNTFRVLIKEQSRRGDGVAHLFGYSVFVKDTQPGDTATVRITKVLKTVAHAQKVS